MITTVSQMIGSFLEVIGVFLMANAYFQKVQPSERLLMFISALRRGEYAKDGIYGGEFSKEDKLASLQGLALIGLGFFIQFLGALFSLII